MGPIETIGCPSGKVTHATYDAAVAQRTSLRRKGDRPGEMEIYRCPGCPGYHVGHAAWKKRKGLPHGH